MSLQESTHQLALKGKMTLFDIWRVHSRSEEITRDNPFKLFGTKIQPILLYVTEMFWGSHKL